MVFLKPRARLLFAALAAIFLVSVWQWYREATVSPVTSPLPSDSAEVLSGVEPLEIVQVEYSKDLDFGKGKFALFTLHIPQDKDFRIEQLTVYMEGASAAEIPEAWLRLNGVRVYTKAMFSGDTVVFTQFPPQAEQPPADNPTLVGIPQQTFQNTQEMQVLLTPTDALPRILQAGSDVSFGIYGHWADTIAPRSHGQGIRFCLKEISGTLFPAGSTDEVSAKPAHTSFAQPACWPSMGIR